ncbi:uncharacterized protein ACN427_013408 isoform 1-T2 [Glossina fuscipes fuscipes]
MRRTVFALLGAEEYTIWNFNKSVTIPCSVFSNKGSGETMVILDTNHFHSLLLTMVIDITVICTTRDYPHQRRQLLESTEDPHEGQEVEEAGDVVPDIEALKEVGRKLAPHDEIVHLHIDEVFTNHAAVYSRAEDALYGCCYIDRTKLLETEEYKTGNLLLLRIGGSQEYCPANGIATFSLTYTG